MIRMFVETVRPHFFDLVDYVTRRSEKLGFPKKKKKKKRRIWRSSDEKHNMMVAETLQLPRI